MPSLHFSKMHGAGNDFVVLDLRSGIPAPSPALCRQLADRHTGVGCDQILTIETARSDNALTSYRIWNADGSASGQCGNGARCIAAWLLRDGAAPAQGDFWIDSPSATHRVMRSDDGGFIIDMGAPRFAPTDIPLVGFDAEHTEYTLDLDGERVTFGAVSMGNPHAVIDVDQIETAAVERVGRALQTCAAFPESVNVGFVQVLSHNAVRLRVFERGAGETLACGSGACAAVAVLARRGRVTTDAPVAVTLPGGTLHIRVESSSGTLWMGGPAQFVFEGVW